MSTVQFNGDTYSEEAFETASRMVANLSGDNPGITRTDIAHVLGQQYDGERDIYDVLGYKEQITEEDYRAKYERQDIAKRIITGEGYVA